MTLNVLRPMRLLFAVLVGTALCLAVAGNAGAMTPGDLLLSCEAVTKTADGRDSGTLDIPAAGLPCWYYMSAIQNMSVLVDERGEGLLQICPPPDTTLLDYVRLFVAYAHRNGTASAGNAAASVVTGLAEAFPCSR